MTAVIEKVTACVTRRSVSGEPNLLVFQTHDRSVQVPAGSVEPGEEISAAATREVTEETGLTGIRLVRFLGSISVELKDGTTMLYKDSMLRGRKATGRVWPRSQWVNVTRRIGSFSEIVIDSTDKGWVPTDSLADRMDRFFYHFEITRPTQERWTVQEKGKLPCECYWVSLLQVPTLDHEPRVWENEFYSLLLDSMGAIAE